MIKPSPKYAYLMEFHGFHKNSYVTDGDDELPHKNSLGFKQQ